MFWVSGIVLFICNFWCLVSGLCGLGVVWEKRRRNRGRGRRRGEEGGKREGGKKEGGGRRGEGGREEDWRVI